MEGENRIAVMGAGLAGAMAALALGQRGFLVDLYEKREDFRVEERREETDKYVGYTTP